MTRLVAGTDRGVMIGADLVAAIGSVRHMAVDWGGWWAIVGDVAIWSSPDGEMWEERARLEGLRANCLLTDGSGVWIGTSEAHLARLQDDEVELVQGFEGAPARDDWYTPWGGPPDVRSLSADPNGVLYANVHVGGILRSPDGGATWEPTVDIDEDVHQVATDASREGRVLAASAHALIESLDGGETWRHARQGLHASYARAVATSTDYDFLSVSSGPSGQRAAVYRRKASQRAFDRCSGQFGTNIDTHCLVADEDTVAFAVEGRVLRSPDQGDSWVEVATADRISCLLVV